MSVNFSSQPWSCGLPNCLVTIDYLGYSYWYHKYTSHCRYIDSTNRKGLTYSLAVNHMTDLSDDELKMMRGYRPSKGPKGGIEFSSDVSVDSTPDTWDWRIQGIVNIMLYNVYYMLEFQCSSFNTTKIVIISPYDIWMIYSNKAVTNIL